MNNPSSRNLAKTWPFLRYSDYEKKLRQAAADWFTARGCKTHSKIKYCLAEWEQWPNNIICPEVSAYINEESVKSHDNKNFFPLHKYLHHGLSSQAMLFNLLGPLWVRNDLEPLLIAFSQNGIEWPKGKIALEFKHDDSKVFNEDSGQPTAAPFSPAVTATVRTHTPRI